MGFPPQHQEPPGLQSAMDPVPDCGENSYRGSGRLRGKRAIITGGDSGIGRAAAIAYAREGADVLIAYLNEDELLRLAWDTGYEIALLEEAPYAHALFVPMVKLNEVLPLVPAIELCIVVSWPVGP